MRDEFIYPIPNVNGYAVEVRRRALIWLHHRMTPESFNNISKLIKLNTFEEDSGSYLNIFSNNSRFIWNYFQMTPLFANDSPMMNIFLIHYELW